MTTREFLSHFPDFAIQTFDDAGGLRKELVRVGRPSEFTSDQIKELNTAGAGVYFTPNRFPTGERKAKLCTGINAWIVECDDLPIEEQWRNINKSPLRPSFVVRSKKSLHCYWLAKDGTLEHYETVVRGLIDFFQADKACKDVSRVFRIPETLHMKNPADPFKIEIEHADPTLVYTEEQMKQAFPYNEPPKREFIPKPVNTNDFWSCLGSLDNRMVLQRMSGHSIVDRELIDFKPRSTGGEYIYVNGEVSDAWIDEHGMIGSGKGGGPTWIQWIGYYKRSKAEIAEWAKRHLEDLIPQPLVEKQKKEQEAEEVSEYFITFREVLKLARKELSEVSSKDVISYGYDWLDQKLTGIFPGELTVLGGETGTGKTTFATNIIYKASKKVKCGVYALEDRLEDYGIKALFFAVNRIKGGIPYPWNEYRKNNITDKNFQSYMDKAEQELASDNIIFARVKKQMTIEALEILITEQAKQGVKLFLIDHLHYFDMSRGDSSKADYIEQTMVRLKTMLSALSVSGLLVVHYRKLNGKKPTMDDFKDSISIAQNASYVINLWRDRSEGSNPLETLFMIPKARNPNGEGTVTVNFDPAINDYKQNTDWMTGTEQPNQTNYSLIDDITF